MPSMDHPWMAGHLAFPPLSKYPWMPELLCHPWTIHGWLATLPSPLCLSIRGCQSYCAIHGWPVTLSSPSKYPWMPELLCHPWTIHGWPVFPPLSKYPWMPELLCHPRTIHGWLATLPSPLCLSIRRCQSYCAIHGPSMDGRPPCLPPSV